MSATATGLTSDQRAALQALVDEHRTLDDHQLLLAAWCQLGDRPDELVLFEIADGFGGNWVLGEEFYSLCWDRWGGLELPGDGLFRIILTNPVEWSAAVERRWASFLELATALRAGQFEVLYADPRGERALEQLQAEAAAQPAVA
ncbi:MAG: hypothetical protein IT204_02180 [Fimbriimonadaceae bacterium]|nr:hypothetical protein [Fimbriimonadaceae bacterium]